MSEAQVFDFDEKRDPLLATVMVSELTPEPGDKDKVTTAYEDMLASVGRTALYNPKTPYIRLLSPGKLSEGNGRVAQTKDASEVHHLTIVGPDAIKLDDEPPVVIPGHKTAELLGLLITVREVVSPRVYINMGFSRQTEAGQARSDALSNAFNQLGIVSTNDGITLLRRTGIRGGAKAGIDAVTVSDMRHTTSYKEARRMNALGHFESYLREGGDHPGLTEIPRIEAARIALRGFAGSGMNQDVERRFSALNIEVAQMLTHTSDIYEEANHMDSYIIYSRQRVASEFAPEWQIKSACDSSTQTLFYPSAFERKDDKIARERRAKEICQGCPVRQECLNMALERSEPDGVWGGLNEEERKHARAFSVTP